ncbi:MAG: serine/threonine-protein kinase [Acidobacteria bacterium]|nr:serine/threonine-protein kinase [Acidobacteriota bacterium]
MALASGARLGPYEIVALLGAGGMGEVYKAVDTRLDRTVALKIMKGAFSDRFTREAKAISALNHPNICTLYDLGTQDGTSYLVMEYLEGKALEGPLPWAEARTFALQLLEALETAHRAGVMHRDVKPANIVVTKSGVKLLDFGLAKSTAVVLGPTDATLTQEGTIQGTPHYMAPEQAAGENVDARGDIFAFGAVLYEMLSGKRAFVGDNAATVIGAVMKDDPLAGFALPDSVPPAVTQILKRCLAKDRERRYQSARDVALDLEEAVVGEAPRVVDRRAWIGGAAAASLVAGVGIGRFWPGKKVAEEARMMDLAIPTPEGHRITSNTAPISPDGRTVTFTTADGEGRRFRWFHPLDGSTPRQFPADATSGGWEWSPDGKRLVHTVENGIQVVNAVTMAVESSHALRTATWCGTQDLLSPA